MTMQKMTQRKGTKMGAELLNKHCPVCLIKKKQMRQMRMERLPNNRIRFSCIACGLSSTSFITRDEIGNEKIVVDSNVDRLEAKTALREFERLNEALDMLAITIIDEVKGMLCQLIRAFRRLLRLSKN